MNNILLPEADVDDIFHYKLNKYRQIDDHCRIRIYRQTKQTICILTELKNSGMSVTNSVEFIIPQVKWLFEQENNPLPEDTIFIEHYDRDSYYDCGLNETFDIITLKNGSPLWNRVTPQTVFDLVAVS